MLNERFILSTMRYFQVKLEFPLLYLTTVNRNEMVRIVGGVSEHVFDPCFEGSRAK